MLPGGWLQCGWVPGSCTTRDTPCSGKLTGADVDGNRWGLCPLGWRGPEASPSGGVLVCSGGPLWGLGNRDGLLPVLEARSPGWKRWLAPLPVRTVRLACSLSSQGGDRALMPPSLLMRTPGPSDQGPTLVASLNLTHLPNSPMSNVLTRAASALTYGWGGRNSV